ncbi:helix-turn-helix domain-containing protein [Nocardia sp. NPDC004068]|uniref:helix-turn-helix domain-containing protein n=1 Tax=Nocardia sp. NPDC004068 TaxID=3364303 RepID=UPI00369C45E2
MPAEGSTFARRALGQKLRALRDRAEISQAAAARVLGISPQTMGRLEEGLSVRSVSDLYMNTLCNLYRVSDEERRLILALACETRRTAERGGGWWQPLLDREIPDFDPCIALEEQAVRLTAWAVIRLPVLVRTPAYSRAVAWTDSPNAPTDQIEGRVYRELKRQARLDDPAFTAEILLSEAALREEWGGPAVMAEQLQHLTELDHRLNVSIRVVPFTTRNHIGALLGSFSLLEFPMMPKSRMTQPPIVYIEEHVGDLYLERPAEIARYRSGITELRNSAST